MNDKRGCAVCGEDTFMHEGVHLGCAAQAYFAMRAQLAAAVALRDAALARAQEAEQQNERLYGLLNNLAIGIAAAPDGFGYRAKHGLQVVQELIETIGPREKHAPWCDSLLKDQHFPCRCGLLATDVVVAPKNRPINGAHTNSLVWIVEQHGNEYCQVNTREEAIAIAEKLEVVLRTALPAAGGET